MAADKGIFPRPASWVGLAFLAGLLLAGCLTVTYRIALELGGAGTATLSYRAPLEYRDLIANSWKDFPLSAAQLKAELARRSGLRVEQVEERSAGKTISLEARVAFDWLGDLSTPEQLFLYFPSRASGPEVRVVIRRGDLPLDSLRAAILEKTAAIPRFGNQKPAELADRIMSESGIFINLTLPGTIGLCQNAVCQGANAEIKVSLKDLEATPYREAVLVFQPSWWNRFRAWWSES